MVSSRFVGVVPVMELRSDHDAVKGPPPPPHVGVQEEAGHDLHDGEGTRHLEREAGGDEEQEGWRQQGAVERVAAEPAHPVQLLRGVVDAVEPPQEADLVAPSVRASR